MQTISLGTVIPSLIRTYVPAAVGAFLGWIVSLGVIDAGMVSPEHQVALTAFLTLVLNGAYYTLIRFLERRYPSLGVLLGSTQQPVDYASGHQVINGEVVASSIPSASSYTAPSQE